MARVVALGKCSSCGKVHNRCKAHDGINHDTPGEPCGALARDYMLVCKMHGGASPNAVAVAEGARVMATLGGLLQECGIAVEGRGPIEAIADALHRANAMTMVLGIMVGQLDTVERDGVCNVLLGEYDRWVRNLAKFAMAADAMGLAERKLQLDMSYARAIIGVIEGTLADLGVQWADPRVPELVARRLEAINATGEER